MEKLKEEYYYKVAGQRLHIGGLVLNQDEEIQVLLVSHSNVYFKRLNTGTYHNVSPMGLTFGLDMEKPSYFRTT
ncbi:MAG: hypothetical protein LBV67_09485 [Streptococcaceae bacterium]|jgi:hypothetical protein|nr:hypothetical protein [Streptococcaceae bacterium]